MMDFPSSFKKSFKSHGSYKQHARKISAGGADDIYHEEQPILSDHSEGHLRHHSQMGDLNDRGEVILNIDDRDASSSAGGGGGNRIWRETSYEFWNSNGKSDGGGQKAGGGGGGEGFYFQPRREGEDPPSRLIGQFLNKQKATGGEMSLDMDLEMDELCHEIHNYARKSPPLAESPTHNTTTTTNTNTNNHHRVSTSKELKVSFQSPSSSNVADFKPQHVKRRYEESLSSSEGEEEEEEGEKTGSQQQQFHNRHKSQSFSTDNCGGEVLRCTSFQRRQSIMRTKKKSRLIDQPEPDPRSGWVGKSGQLRSGMLGRASGMLGKLPDEEEDDPWFDEDIPDEFKKGKVDTGNELRVLE